MPTIDLREYLDGLYSYAVMLSRNRTEAEDLVQETCLRAIPAMQRLRPDSNVKSWLFTILRNVWFNQLRQWRRAPEIVELESDGTGQIRAADTAKDPHETYVSNIEQEQVRNAIQQLSIQHREIIILREYEELSYAIEASRPAFPSRRRRTATGKESHNRQRGDRKMRSGQGG